MKIEHVEKLVLRALKGSPGKAFRIVELVDEIRKTQPRILPVDIKIAALNLVRDRKAHMTPDWCIVV